MANKRRNSMIITGVVVFIGIVTAVVIAGFGQSIEWIVGVVDGLVHFSMLYAQCLHYGTCIGRHCAIILFVAEELQAELVSALKR